MTSVNRSNAVAEEPGPGETIMLPYPSSIQQKLNGSTDKFSVTFQQTDSIGFRKICPDGKGRHLIVHNSRLLVRLCQDLYRYGNDAVVEVKLGYGLAHH